MIFKEVGQTMDLLLVKVAEEYHDIENVLEVHMDFRETGKYNAVYLISSENGG